MKHESSFRSAILLTALFLSINAFADVRIKTRTTHGAGQTTEGTTYIKGKRERTEENPGAAATVTITQCDLRRSVEINPRSQIYLVNPWRQNENPPAISPVNARTAVEKGGTVTMTITMKDTGETRKMFGYVARHLIITTETDSSPDACNKSKMKMVTDGWYIDADFALKCDYGANSGFTTNSGGGCRDKYDVKTIGTAKRGFPLIEKSTMFDDAGKETYTMTREVVELSNTVLDAALFDVPQGYREVKDRSAFYAPESSSNPAAAYNSDNQKPTPANPTSGAVNSTNGESDSRAPREAKKPGTLRIGLAGVKTGAVGEGVSAADLAAAIQNTLPQYLKGTRLEIVALEARIASAIETEAAQKECDYVLYAVASHKKGGGGLFGKTLGKLSETVAGRAYGSADTVGKATQISIMTAAAASGNVKAKDEIALEIKLNKNGAPLLAGQFKAKAKGDGEDIISQVVEQAAAAIVEATK